MEEIQSIFDDATNYSNIIVEYVMEYGLKVIFAILVLIVGLWIIKMITNGLRKAMDKRNFDLIFN